VSFDIINNNQKQKLRRTCK